MDTPIIPAGMCPAVSPYSFGSPGGVERTDVEGGSARYSLGYDRGIQTFTVTLMLLLDQFSVWNAFFLRVIKKGSITFQMDIDSGMGLEPHLCNIVPGSYSATLTSGTVYAVSFQVDAEAASTYDLTTDEVDGLIGLNDASGGHPRRLIDRLAIFANWDTNVLNF